MKEVNIFNQLYFVPEEQIKLMEQISYGANNDKLPLPPMMPLKDKQKFKSSLFNAGNDKEIIQALFISVWDAYTDKLRQAQKTGEHKNYEDDLLHAQDLSLATHLSKAEAILNESKPMIMSQQGRNRAGSVEEKSESPPPSHVSLANDEAAILLDMVNNIKQICTPVSLIDPSTIKEVETVIVDMFELMGQINKQKPFTAADYLILKNSLIEFKDHINSLTLSKYKVGEDAMFNASKSNIVQIIETAIGTIDDYKTQLPRHKFKD